MEELFLLRGKRLKEAVEYLRSTNRIRTQKELADKVGCSVTQLSRAIAGNQKDMNQRFIERINRNFERIFNEEYIWNGNGSLLAKKDGGTTTQETVIKENAETTIPISFSMNKETDDLTSIVKGFLKLIEQKDKTIAFLTEQIQEKDETISLLRKQLTKYIENEPLNKKESSERAVNM